MLEAIAFLLEPRTVIAFPRDAMAAVELKYPLSGIVEEVAIMRDAHNRAREAQQELLKPIDGFRIEMVGWLVEQQHVGLGQQQAAQRDAALLTA